MTAGNVFAAGLAWVTASSAAGPVEQAPAAGAGARAAATSSDPALAEAKAWFEQGNALRKRGEFQRALEFDQRSRARVPSLANTLNAAFCLERLARDDEALELYELILVEFSRSLDAERSARLEAKVQALRARLTSLDVTVDVDGLLVVDGRMRGKLPLQAPVRVKPGGHRVIVIKDGYESFDTRVEGVAGGTIRVEAKLRPLAAGGRRRVEAPTRLDRTHPRWARPESSTLWVDAFGGYAFGPSLGSGAEQCAAVKCAESEQADGALAGARGSFESPGHWAAELAAGYLATGTSLARGVSVPYPVAAAPANRASYQLADTIRVQGPFASVGLSYFLSLGEGAGVQARLHVGALFASARDSIEARVGSGGVRAPAVVERGGAVTRSVALLVLPEIQAQYRVGRLRFGFGIAVVYLPARGPDNEHGELAGSTADGCATASLTTPSCAKGSAATRDERAFGPLWLLTPAALAGYAF